MSLQPALFYMFSGILVFAALMVITRRNPVHSALFLVLAFFNMAAIWLFLEAEFLAITLVLVYVGAVMVLVLFVVMMLDINLAPLREGFTRYLPLGGLVAFAVFVEMVLVLWSQRMGSHFALGSPIDYSDPAVPSNTVQLGRILYTQYMYPFEIAAVVLLVAIVAAITLTLRRRPGTRKQDPVAQIQVQASDRLRIVKMKASPPQETQPKPAERPS